MRIAVISDIHGNLEALETALEFIHAQKAERIYCLGDIVGYGANPSECLEIVKAEAYGIVLGNHDEAVFQHGAENGFSHLAANAIHWTRNQLNDKQITYLKSLPYSLSFQNILLVHAAPTQPKLWKYIFNGMDAAAHKNSFTERLCFVGHSHIPGVYSMNSDQCDYNSRDRFLINVGSIGQPRDGDPRLSFGLLDTFAGTYENIRLEYNHATAANKIRNSELPSYLADRLFQGK